MINFNPNISSISSNSGIGGIGAATSKATNPKSGFSDTVKAAGELLSKVDDHQQSSDLSIKDLLSGRSEDIASTVSEVAKADMSFKLLVGVRNKLIEAYKQTMNMPL